MWTGYRAPAGAETVEVAAAPPGDPVECCANKVWGGEVLPVGPHLFRAGLIFSVGLTLVLPMILMAFFFVVRVVGALL